jgi:type IV pilus assembly protein PilX
MSRLERGAALVVALILLAAMSVLGITGMTTVVTELALARNFSNRQAAFEAAAAGIDLALAAAPFPIDAPKTVDYSPLGRADYTVSATIRFRETTDVPLRGFSIGSAASGLEAYHYEIVSRGTAPSNAQSTQRQGFFVLGPRLDR